MTTLRKLIGTISFACAASAANAALINGGDGLVYDNVLDITWMQDAALAASVDFGVTGIQDDGTMDWNTGVKWIEAMNQVNYLGFKQWRMPTVEPVNGSFFQYSVSYDGSTDKGFNNYSVSNELSHLWYSSLGNIGTCTTANPTGTLASDCIQSPYGTWGLKSTGPFSNLVEWRYWTGVKNTENNSRAFDFDTTGGRTGTGTIDGAFYVWAVIDGDVAGLATVPVPAAGWLLVSGIMGLMAFTGRGMRNA